MPTSNFLEGSAGCSLLINSFLAWKLETLSQYYTCVHAFVSVHQPGNDVSQRINRARHFMRAASSCLNRTEVIQPFMKILCLYYEMVHKCYSAIIHTGTCTCIGCNIECKHFCVKVRERFLLLFCWQS